MNERALLAISRANARRFKRIPESRMNYIIPQDEPPKPKVERTTCYLCDRPLADEPSENGVHTRCANQASKE